MFKFNKKMLLSVLFIAVLALYGCGSDDSSSDDSSSEDNSSDEESYKIKLAHGDQPSEDAIIHWTAEKFAELVDEYSDGKIEVEIYPSNQLGSNVDTIRSVQNGTVEMVQANVNNFGELVPALNYLVLPYLLTDTDEARGAVDKLWDEHNEILKSEADMRFVTWTDAGFRNLTSDEDHPVRTVDDLDGFKLRIPPNQIAEKIFGELGAQTEIVDYSEVYTALQQGVVHGQENANTTARTEQYYEVQKYITDIKWQYTLSAFAISEEFFQSLPEDLQEAVTKAGREATDAERARIDKLGEEDVEYLKEQGVEFLGEPEDFEKWVEAGKSVWPEVYELIGGGDAEKGEEFVDEMITKLEE